MTSRYNLTNWAPFYKKSYALHLASLLQPTGNTLQTRHFVWQVYSRTVPEMRFFLRLIMKTVSLVGLSRALKLALFSFSVILGYLKSKKAPGPTITQVSPPATKPLGPIAGGHLLAKWMIVSCFAVAGWVVWLFIHVPPVYNVTSWDVAWVGFDAGLFICLLGATISIWTKSAFSILFLAMLATMLLLDSWFDVATSNNDSDFTTAISLAVFLELPIAVALLRLVTHLVLRVAASNNQVDTKLRFIDLKLDVFK